MAFVGQYAAGSNYIGMSSRDEKLVFDTIHEFNSMQVWRNMHASMWEETANLIATNYVNTFFFQNFNWPGMKKTDKQIDATCMLALDPGASPAEHANNVIDRGSHAASASRNLARLAASAPRCFAERMPSWRPVDQPCESRTIRV